MLVSFAVVAPFSEFPEPAWDATEPVEPLVSTLVAAGEVPVWGPPSEVLVSFAVPATSELPEPACDAAEPVEPPVSTWVAAGDVPVAGATLPGVAGEFVPVCPAAVVPVLWLSPSVSSAIWPALNAITSEAAARLLRAAESMEGAFLGTGTGFGLEALRVSITTKGELAW